MNGSVPERDHQIDIIRALLIFLVVFGHMLELVGAGPLRLNIYRIIYSFHMPAFLFVSGYFAKYDPKKILVKILLPYVVFQVLYSVFTSFPYFNMYQIQFTLPYWLLWYLLALFIYYLTLPLFETSNRDTAIMILIVCIFISLISGFDSSATKILSISRILAFLPFFVGGYYARKFNLKDRITKNKAFILIFSAIVSLIWEVYYYIFDVSVDAMYASTNYGANFNGMAPRFMFLAGACSWIIFLLAAIPEKKIPFISTIGQRTIAVFLLHGFIVKALEKTKILNDYSLNNIALAFLIAIAITTLLAAIPVKEISGRLKQLYKAASIPLGNKRN